MNALLLLLLRNALLALPWAVLAFVLGRTRRFAALGSALWLVVLLRLVAPPILPLPVLPVPDGPSRAVPLATPVPESGSTSSPASTSRLVSTASASATPPPSPSLVPPRHGPAPATLALLAATLLWGLGALTLATLLALRRRRLGGLLSRASPASAEGTAEAAAAARAVGVLAPRVLLVPGRVAPFALGGPRRSTLVLPSLWWGTLGPSARRAVLLHEMAHLRRRDPLARTFEALLAIPCWWNPLLWVARRERRRLAEEASDARALEALPSAGPAYARALLDALDFLAGAPARGVPASAFTTFRDTRRRLEMIRHSLCAPRLGPLGRVGLALLACALLVSWPVAVHADEDHGQKPPVVVQPAPPEGRAPAPQRADSGGHADSDLVLVSERIAYVEPPKLADVLRAVLGDGAPTDRAIYPVGADAVTRFRDAAPLVSAPTVALLPGTEGVVTVGEEQGVVTRYAVKGGEGGAPRTVDPVVETIRQGLEVRVNSAPEGAGGRVRTRTEVVFTRLVSCEKEEIEVQGRTVQVDRPVVRRSSVEATVSTTPDRDALIVGPEVDGKTALVLLHAVLVPARK